METIDALSSLAALAHASRLAVFRLLVQAGPSGLAASKIAQQLAIPASSLSFHLKELSHAKLVIAMPHGRSIIYAAQFATINQLLAYLTENCCGSGEVDPACNPLSSLTCSDSK